MRRRDAFDFGLLKALSRAGEKLPRRLELEILAHEEEAVEPLCELLGDESWGELHAVRLIRALGAERAMDALISTLAECDPMDRVHGEICETLAGLGSPVVEPVLEALSRTDDEEYRHALAWVLAGTPAGNAAVRAALEEVLAEDAVLGACLLGEYGDRQALGTLTQALDEYELRQESGPFPNEAVVELAEAIRDLGGELTESQQAKLQEVGAMRRAWLTSPDDSPPAPAVGAPPRPGRNDPCPCGSGKKYKHCHLREDELPPA